MEETPNIEGQDKPKVGREKGWSNLLPQYGKKVLEEIQAANKAEVIARVIALAPAHYPNVTRLAREANISRAYLRYLIDTDEQLKLALEEHFKAKLDAIEENVLNTAQKEQYASSAGVFVLKSQHPRYREEKQSLTANVSINFGGGIVGNPYQNVEDAQEIPDNEKPDDSDT